MQFCDDDSKRCLVVPENMKIDHVVPSKLSKGKVLLFVKLQSCALTLDSMAANITVLELGSNPFEHLELLANEVFLPVLSNPQNQAKWGEVPTREIMDRFHNFLSSTTILCGQIKGETRLPMPPIDLTGGPSTAGKNRISLLEGAIITWTKQIRSVLKQDPESQLKQVKKTIFLFRVNFYHDVCVTGNASNSRCRNRFLEKQSQQPEQYLRTASGPSHSTSSESARSV